MGSFAAFSIKKPDSCAGCEILTSRNRYSGSCIINKNFRMPLDDSKRASSCPLVFIDNDRCVFPATEVKEAFAALLTAADELENQANDRVVPDEVALKAIWKRQGILEAMKMFADKLRVIDIQEWFEE